MGYMCNLLYTEGDGDGDGEGEGEGKGEEERESIIVGGQNINSFCFAKDTALVAE